MINPFAPSSTQSVAVTVAEQTLSFPDVNGSRTLRLVNSGSTTIFILINGSTTVTTANGFPMLGNTVEMFAAPNTCTVRVIAGGAGSTLYVTSGMGI